MIGLQEWKANRQHRAYERKRRDLVSNAIDNQLGAFERDEPLPANYGIGVDERAVEFPWVFGKGLSGRILDAGATLNHEHIIDRLSSRADSLHITTLVPGSEPFHSNKISYIFADLRDLPLRDETYDQIASLSTLEHVGMDNSGYGAEGTAATDPDIALADAMSELRRVLKPGGRLFVTVPYGANQQLGWFRQFNKTSLQGMIDSFEPTSHTVDFFRYEATGWRRASEAECADAEYRVGPEPADHARAARAVACIELTK